RRRGVPARVDRESPGEARRGVSADHADVPGSDRRGGPPPAGRLHQVPLAAGPRGRGGPPGPGAAPRKEGRTATSQPPPAQAVRPPRVDYLNSSYGVRSWLLTSDHKRIAILYLIGVTIFFAIGGVAAGLVRLELLTPAGDVFQAETYNKIFTTHGVMMVFFFLIPAIPAAPRDFPLPPVVGAQEPR